MKYCYLLIALIITRASAGNNCEQMSTHCPFNPTWPVYLPNPGDCGSYCKCDCMGTAHYFPCEPGLYFNPENQTCQVPVYGSCVDPAPPRNGCEKVTSCPALNSNDVLLVPNPDSCSSYCMCDWGTAIYVECQRGLHFNAVEKVCDWPYRAKCKL